MKNPASIVEQRAPVWKALSELFLDTELQAEDHERIARVLVASPYSEEKLDEILRLEVTPILRPNLMCVAGEWVGFDESWMRKKMTPLINKRPLFSFGVFWMVREDWKAILSRVSAHRLR